MKSRTLVVSLMVVCMTQAVSASQIVATITGTVSEGSDVYGGIFAGPHTDLTGRDFTIVYTFDDTKGQQTITSCCAQPPIPVKSEINGTGASSPGNAVLQIGGIPYVFPSSTYSDAYRTAPPINSTAWFDVIASDAVNDSRVFALVYPAADTILTPDYNWESSFSDPNLVNAGVYGFHITVNTGNGYLYATGELAASSITVSGLDASAPEPATYALFGVGLAAVGGLARHRKNQLQRPTGKEI